MPREIEIQWTTSNGPGKVSVMYFNEGVAVATQRTALQTWMAGTVGALDTGTSYVIATSGREWDATDGSLTGAWSETSSKTGAGTAGGEPVPDVCQLLYRWGTGVIADRRFVAGRTFIPGCARINDIDGNVESTIRAALSTVAQTFASSASTPVVWHRPVFDPESGALLRAGSEHQMTTGSVWEEFAVLRRRRG